MSLPDLAAAEVRLMLLEDLPAAIVDQVKPYELAMLARAFLRGWTAHARKTVLEEREAAFPTLLRRQAE